eukprot:364771-Chlamydomonas_euryale.AAC.3
MEHTHMRTTHLTWNFAHMRATSLAMNLTHVHAQPPFLPQIFGVSAEGTLSETEAEPGMAGAAAEAKKKR